MASEDDSWVSTSLKSDSFSSNSYDVLDIDDNIDFLVALKTGVLTKTLKEEYNWSHLRECYSESQKGFISDVVTKVFEFDKSIRQFAINMIRAELFNDCPDMLRVFIGKNREVLVCIDFDLFNEDDYFGAILEVYLTNGQERGDELLDLNLEPLENITNYLL